MSKCKNYINMKRKITPLELGAGNKLSVTRGKDQLSQSEE
jgi:hypothetical protein